MRSAAHKFLSARSIAALALVAALPLPALSAKPGTSGIPMVANVFSSVYDEQTGLGCPFPPYDSVTDGTAVGVRPDRIPGATYAWDFGVGSPWDPVTGLTSGLYENGTFPVSAGSHLTVQFQTNNKVFSIDTRTTAGPVRGFNLNFTQAYDPVINHPAFGDTLATPALFEVSGLKSLTSLGICSSKACPESEPIRAKMWFDDPTTDNVEWRVDWQFIRVMRVTQNTWYFIADACDGSQLAGLSQLVGNRTKPREVNSGLFLMPLFIGVTIRQ